MLCFLSADRGNDKSHYALGTHGQAYPIGVRLHCIFHRLTSDLRESVLDDSTYDRSRSKKVELLSRVFDHSSGRYLLSIAYICGLMESVVCPWIFLCTAKEKP